MPAKTFVRSIDAHAHLHRDPGTGLAWVENNHAGVAHTVHPSTGGTMAHARDLYGPGAVLARVRGFIYNLNGYVGNAAEPYDVAAGDACQCEGCDKRRAG